MQSYLWLGTVAGLLIVIRKRPQWMGRLSAAILAIFSAQFGILADLWERLRSVLPEGPDPKAWFTGAANATETFFTNMTGNISAPSIPEFSAQDPLWQALAAMGAISIGVGLYKIAVSLSAARIARLTVTPALDAAAEKAPITVTETPTPTVTLPTTQGTAVVSVPRIPRLTEAERLRQSLPAKYQRELTEIEKVQEASERAQMTKLEAWFADGRIDRLHTLFKQLEMLRKKYGSS